MTNNPPTLTEAADHVLKIGKHLQREYFAPFPSHYSDLIGMYASRKLKEATTEEDKERYELMQFACVMMRKHERLIGKTCADLNRLYEQITGTELTIEQQMFP
jgi:hypothetical protein